MEKQIRCGSGRQEKSGSSVGGELRDGELHRAQSGVRDGDGGGGQTEEH